MKDPELLKRSSPHHPSSPPAPLCAQATSHEGVSCIEHELKGQVEGLTSRYESATPCSCPTVFLQAQIFVNT